MRSLVAIALLFFAGCTKKPHRYTTGEIEQAVRSGKVSREIAHRIVEFPSLSVRELSASGVPVQLFAFDDHILTHTVLVDGVELVLLCSGPKGSIPYDLRLEQNGSLRAVTFKLDTPNSAGSPTMRGRAYLGSTPAEGFMRRE